MNYKMCYTLLANDGGSKVFCEHQLELSEFATSALKDIVTNNWADHKEKELHVPAVSSKMLEYIHEWMTIALRVAENKRRFHRPSPSHTPSMIMKNGLVPTGHTFTYRPPIIDESITWTEKGTGLAESLLDWAEKCRQKLSMYEYFQLMDAANFMIINDMLELLACRLSWEMIQARNAIFIEAEKTKRYRMEYMSFTNKLAFFKKWLETPPSSMISQELYSIKSLFQEIQHNFTVFDHLRNVVVFYQQTGGPPVPRETWTEQDWADFGPTKCSKIK
ncbi:MAG: hypothetical protein EBT86_00895 [Actinobacteria bacterium]|nr:hypothetical protein [Actinomycetota bacterium]